VISRNALSLFTCLFLGCATAGSGWRVTETHEYGRDNLYLYLNGGAEYFLENGVQALTVLEHVYGGLDVTATVEVYDMAAAEQARELHNESVSAAARSLDVGTAGAIYPGYAEFWQGTRYVRIIAYDLASSAAKRSDGMQALVKLARLVVSKL